MDKTTIVTELKAIYGDLGGAVRLHWESDEDEARCYGSLDEALDAVADVAIAREMTADEIERIAYIVTEAEYFADV